MNRRYYITPDGQVKDSACFYDTYILVRCGTKIEFSPGKIRRLLSSNKRYVIDLSEKTLGEISYKGNFFGGSYPQIMDRPSSMSLKEFLNLLI